MGMADSGVKAGACGLLPSAGSPVSQVLSEWVLLTWARSHQIPHGILGPMEKRQSHVPHQGEGRRKMAKPS